VNKRALIFRGGAVLVLVAVAALMLVIGRGHTIYLDNRTIEYNGQTYEAPYRIEVLVDGEQTASLASRERGSAICIGQSFNMTLNVTEERDGAARTIDIKLPVPYNMDGVIINLPAYLADLPEEAYLSEFIPAPEEPEEEEAPGSDEIPAEDEFLGDI
jgi:hypothetical protein